MAIIGDPAFAIIDLPSGAVVTATPRGVRPMMWTKDGIYLIDEPDKVERWQPGSPPWPIFSGGELYCSGNGGSFRAVTLRLGGSDCVGYMSLSPTGQYGLTANFIGDVDSGSITLLRGYPGGGYQDYPSPDEWLNLQWEDDTHVVITMEFRATAQAPLVTVLVRCDAETGNCERISQRLVPDGTPEPDVGYALVP